MGIFGLPNIGGTPVIHRWTMIAILYGLVLVVGFLIHRFDHSQLGRAASATFVNPQLATSLGIDIKKLGILLQTFSCTLAGGCGVLYGFIYKSFHLDYFTFHLVGITMTIIFVGGYATLWGVVLAAPVLYGVPLLFPPEIASWRIVIYGVLLILVLVLKPEGFITPAVRLSSLKPFFRGGGGNGISYPVRRAYEDDEERVNGRGSWKRSCWCSLSPASGSARQRWSSTNGRSRS